MLDELINADAISGKEEPVRRIIRKRIKPYVDTMNTDKIGNLIARKKGNKPIVMLAAHMDEVGLMVKSIDDDGKIRFSPVGGVDEISIIGHRVNIGKLRGLITSKEMSRGEIVKELPGMDELFVETGLSKKELRKKGVKIGSYISFHSCGYTALGSEKIVAGKALDDRLGCHVLLELAKRLKNVKNEIVYAFTVQEEMGMYGAKVSAYNIEPDWALVVDVTDADEGPRKMGHGSCITVKDSEMIGNRCINEWLEEIARKKKIPVQMEVSDSGTTDALSISLSRSGVPTAVIGMAIKNMHSPISIAHMDDINNTIKLIEQLLRKPPKVCIM